MTYRRRRRYAAVAPVDNMNKLINPRNVPYFEGIAVTGPGVFETLKNVTKQVLTELKKHY